MPHGIFIHYYTTHAHFFAKLTNLLDVVANMEIKHSQLDWGCFKLGSKMAKVVTYKNAQVMQIRIYGNHI